MLHVLGRLARPRAVVLEGFPRRAAPGRLRPEPSVRRLSTAIVAVLLGVVMDTVLTAAFESAFG